VVPVPPGASLLARSTPPAMPASILASRVTATAENARRAQIGERGQGL
jgi:hypothetical protein